MLNTEQLVQAVLCNPQLLPLDLLFFLSIPLAANIILACGSWRLAAGPRAMAYDAAVAAASPPHLRPMLS